MHLTDLAERELTIDRAVDVCDQQTSNPARGGDQPELHPDQFTLLVNSISVP